LPKSKKPGFSDNLSLLTDILCKNPVSEPQAIALLGMEKRDRLFSQTKAIAPPESTFPESNLIFVKFSED
jgi:hypothetical protein